MEYGALQAHGGRQGQQRQGGQGQDGQGGHGGQVGQGGQGQAVDVQLVPAVRKVAGGAKAPKYDNEGGFDLFKARFESFLRQRDCWSVVIGDELPNAQDAEQQRIYEERNLFARDTLLSGLMSRDAKKICKMASVHEMWTAFEREKTKRDFGNSIRVRGQLYGAKYRKGMNMSKYLDKLEDYRRQLENMGDPINDAEMAKIILTGVEGTHRNVVRMFSHVDEPPDLDRVRNTLRGEAEMDKAEAGQSRGSIEEEEEGGKLIGSLKKGKRPWKGKQKKVGGGKKVPGAGKWKETRSCHRCHQVGHLMANCKELQAERQAKQRDSDDDDDGSEAAQPKPKGKQKKSKKIGFVGRWSSDSRPIGMVRLVREVDDSQVDDLRVLSCTSKEFTQAWMLDTGTDVHVCTSATSFHGEMEEDRDYFDDWKGRSNKSDGIGLVRVRTANGFDSEGDDAILELEETRFSPNGPCNLISQERLEMDGWVPETPFTSSPSERITYFINEEYPGVQLVFKKKRGHYWLDASPVAASAQVCAVTPTPKNNKLLTWHMRFAHQNVEAMKLMIKKKMILGVDSLTMEDFKKPFRCIACQRAKQKRMSFRRKRAKRQKVCYARMMSDISPVGVLTPGGNLYFQLIQDEASRFKWCYLLKEKSDANQNIMDLVLQIEKEHAIKIFSCDRGGEFVNTELKVFLKRHGIRLLTTNSYTPEENCLVEKMNGCLMNKVRAINEAAGLPMCLWGEVLGYVVEVDNMSSTKALNGMTPHEKLHGTKPQVRDLHVCGSVVFQHVPKKKRQGKLDRRADPGIFLGYAKTSLGYRILDLVTGNLVERRDVIFYEDMAADPQYVRDLIDARYFDEEIELPAHINFVPLPVSRMYLPPDNDEDESDEVEEGKVDDDEPMQEDDEEFYDTDDGMAEPFDVDDEEYVDSNPSSTSEDDERIPGGNEIMEVDETRQEGASSGKDADTEVDAAGDGGSANRNVRRRTGGSTAAPSVSTAGRTLRRSTRIRRAPQRFTMAMTLMNCMLIATVCNLLNPTTVSEALASEEAPQWQRAMEEEYQSHMRNGTWELVPRPKPERGKPLNILTSLWVLVRKWNEKGEIERHKARLAIKGYRQKYGLDYLETYSPVVRIESVRLILLLALLFGLECHHVDFVTAFLNGVLVGVEIFMEQPEGYDDGTGRVCRLLKGLYGLKQASRIWNNTLHEHLIALGFKKCAFDAGVYWKAGEYNKIFLTVYVDDILIAADSRDIAIVVKALGEKFKLKNLGRVKHLLGMEINYQPGKMLCLSQTSYVERMLEKFGLAEAKPVRSPQMHNEGTLPVEKDPRRINDPDLPFREMVGSLQYLVHCTRPDLANGVRTLGRYGGSYTKENFRQAQRVMRYLRSTMTLGLVYRYSDVGSGGVRIDAFADADHAGCPETSKSVSGWTLRLNANVWHWQSKKQGSVADDTCAAELIAAHKCTKEIKWAQKLLKELGVNQEVQATLFCDNQSTIKEVANNGNSQNQKHLAKKTRSIAEWVDRGRLQLEYVPTTENIADIFTKALGPCVFERLRGQLNIEDVREAWSTVGTSTVAVATTTESGCESDISMSEL